MIRPSFPRLIPAVLLVAGACTIVEGTARLENSFRSPEAAARAVLAALERKDRESLEGFLVTREEHETLLWDALPESKRLPFGYARSLNMRNTRTALDHAFREYAGSRFEFVRLEFTKPAEAYDDFTLHRGARLWVRRVSDGREGYLPILDVVLEYGGRWKPMNYDE